jgi:putative transposase
MKKVRFTEEQMVAILREADKTPVAEVAKKHKISEQTIYNWRRHFGTLEPVDVKRLRALESENGSSSASWLSAISRSTRLRRSTAESGELAGTSGTGRIRVHTWPLPATRLRAVRSSTIGAVVSVGSSGARCAGSRSNETAGGAVSALRLSSHSDLAPT